MADAVISVVVEQLASFVQTEVKLVVGVRKDVTSFTSTLGMLQAVIRDAEKRQITEESVKLWLDELKDIVYDAEDVLDEWNTRRLQKNQILLQGGAAAADVVDDSHVGILNKILSCLSTPCFAVKSISVRYDIGSRIKEIRQRLDEVANQLGKFKFTESQSHEEHRRQPTSSKVNLSEIFGRDHDKQVIVSRLLGESSSDQETNVPVISIVGTGGFGKTTLAKLILEEARVKDAFARRMWVCVSQPFNLIEVTKAIIEEAGEQVPTVHGWPALHRCLCDSLKGKQFLLVLDDVWTDDPNEWCQLRDSLEGGAPGSRIVVTTRNEKVAKMMNSTYTHILGKLSDDDCWLLFKHIAFHGRRQEDIQKLEEVGKQIAEKCKGVPLAVKTVASLVHLQKTKKDWNHVLGSDVWGMQQNGTGFLPSLLLSYNSLPSNLKQCFMFCAIYPKDTQLEKDELVTLWMSQGFLGSNGDTDLEKIGENCFDELAMRSFFQDFEEDEDGNITSCKMHDLVHDFAEFLTKKERFIFAEGENVDGSKSRHVRLFHGNYSPDIDGQTRIFEFFNLMRCARSLDLSKCYWVEKLPAEVKRLLHLRYLDLSGTSLSELPETIGDLQNLQTLKLNRCGELRRLPDGIGKLLNLRHLEMEETDQLEYLPRGIGRLRSLRTLSKLMVGGVESCSLGALKHLNFLQGSLEIEGLEHVVDENDAAEAELKKKENLETLTLKFGYAEENDVEKTTKILKALQPHENLEKLYIDGFGVSKFPLWMSSNSVLANLVELVLNGCHECAELPALGKLPSLEKLDIRVMSRVKRIGHEFYGFSEANNNKSVVAFPKLKELTFEYMENVVEWEIPVDDVNGRKYIIMPRLRDVVLGSCRKLRKILDLNKCKDLETIRITRMDELEELEEGEEVETGSITKGAGGGDDADLPCLRQVSIDRCLKLKRIPPYMFPRTLKKLCIGNCPNLRGIQQPCLPPLLEKLKLYGDVGIFSESLPVNEEEEESSQSQNNNNNNTTNYPHLKSVKIWSFTHPSLPKGFNHLTAIQDLRFIWCESLDFELDELKHLTMLQDLEIDDCPILKKRFEDEDWMSKLSHVRRVKIY